MNRSCVKLSTVALGIHVLVQYFITSKFLEFYQRDFNYTTIDDDLNHDIHSLVAKHGYLLQNHTVLTDDGYILQLHRISSTSPNLTTSKNIRRPIFIQHGIFVSSIVWLLEGPHRALAYKFADKGFDVWLGNTRGNVYSREHVIYNYKKEPELYYDYSFHEIGVYDIAASIDHVLNITGYEKLDYIGHSQGCIVFFVLMSEKPEYADKIGKMVAMAPSVYTEDAWSPSVILGRMFHRQIEWIWNKFKTYHIFSDNNFGGKYATAMLCSDGSILQVICQATYYIIGGYNPHQLNTTLLPLFFTHAPAGSSTKQVIHYMQLSKTGKFRQFDYESTRNMVKYGQELPLNYVLSIIKIPCYIFYSDNDFYSSENDTLKLAQSLQNVKKIVKISDPRFTHFNFMMSKNIYEVLNNKIINIFL